MWPFKALKVFWRAEVTVSKGAHRKPNTWWAGEGATLSQQYYFASLEYI